MGVRWWQMPKLLLQGIGDFNALLPTMDPCEGMPDTIKKLHKRGNKLFIVTSNTHENVTNFLKLNNLQDYFIDIKSVPSLFKKSKHIRRLIKENNLKRRETIYVGDETRDIQAARLSFIKVVSVSWGFNTRKILAKQRPNFLIDNSKELLDIRLEGKK
jgi:phosphoglycolate phosphatase